MTRPGRTPEERSRRLGTEQVAAARSPVRVRIAVESGALPDARPDLAEPLMERYRAIFG